MLEKYFLLLLNWIVLYCCSRAVIKEDQERSSYSLLVRLSPKAAQFCTMDTHWNYAEITSLEVSRVSFTAICFSVLRSAFQSSLLT